MDDDDTLLPVTQVSGTHAVVAGVAEAPKGHQKTLIGAAPPVRGPAAPVAEAPTLASPLAQEGPLGEPAAEPVSGVRSTVGNELKRAKLERFDEVTRDRYAVLDELARGGLGRIFRAQDPRTGRIVAIKEVLQPSPDIVQRFVREAMVTANLQHPSIVPVYEVGRWPSGEPFYAMKLVEGRNLDEMIKERTSLSRRLELLPHVIDIAEALAYAHAEHVIHRDLKPGNVLVGPYGETVVIDWGLARNLDVPEDADEPLVPRATLPPDTMTVVGAVLGTPCYMPPEQAQGMKLDERADVYSIGAILYQLLGGKRPFIEATTMEELLDLVAFKRPRPVRELEPELPDELVAIVEKAMAYDAVGRYANAQGLAEDLRRYLQGQLVAAHRYTAWQLVRRWIAKHRALVAMGVAGFAALVVVGAISVRQIQAERDEARKQRHEAETQRTVARDAQMLAETRYATSLEELGRQEALLGLPDRALPLFAGAVANRDDLPSTLSLLLGQAQRAYAGLIGIAPAHTTDVAAGDFGVRSSVTITADNGGHLRAWDFEAGRELWSADGASLFTRSPDGALLLVVDAKGALALRSTDSGLERARWNVAGAVKSMAWSPQGGRFAVLTKANEALWGAVGDGQLHPLRPAGEVEVHHFTFSPDGNQLVSCGDDSLTLIHAVPAGTLVAELKDGDGAVYTCSYTDPGVIITGGIDRIAKRWQLAAKTIDRRYVHTGMVYSVLRTGDTLVVLGSGAEATLWTYETAVERAKLGGHKLSSYDARMVAGTLITVDEAGNVYGWDPETGERLLTFPREGTQSWIASHDDRLFIFGDGRERLWKVEPSALLQRVPGHSARVRSVTWGTDNVLWTVSNDGTVRATQLDYTKPPRVFGTGGFSEDIIPDPMAPTARKPPNPNGMRSLALLPDGVSLVTTNENGSIIKWAIGSGTEVARWVGHTGRVRKVVLSADGTIAWTVGDTTVRRWDVATGKELARADVGAIVFDVALVTPDRIATQTDDQRHALWDATTLKPISVEIPSNIVRELYAADGIVVGATEYGLWLEERDKVVARIPHHQTFSVHTTMTADGRRLLAAGSTRGTVSIYDITAPADAKLLRTLTVAEDLVGAVSFRAGGDVLAASSFRMVTLYDPATGNLLAKAPELPAMVGQLVWSPDGMRLAIAGGAGIVWIWNLGPGQRDGLPAFVRCVSSWQLEDSSLSAVPNTPDTRCSSEGLRSR